MTNKYLFAFENDNSVLVETKLLNMPEGTPPAQVYFWIQFDKKTNSCQHLNFVAMEKEPVQVREFKEGRLEFNNDKANFNGVSFKNIDVNTLSEDVKNSVVNFLDKKKKKTFKPN